MNKRITEMLLLGFDVIKGRVSIFKINSQITRYQVYSDDFRFPFSAVYDEEDIETAVDKFLLVIRQIKEKSEKSKKRVDAV